MFTLLSLNTCQGNIRAPLLDFLRQHREVDIFCLQEVHVERLATELKPYSNLYADIETALDGYTSAGFAPFGDCRWGNLSMVRKDIRVVSSEEIWTHEHVDYIVPEGKHKHERARSMVASVLDVPGHGRILVCNVHGCGEPTRAKCDTPESIRQSQRILEYVASVGLPTVIMGDFNLLPDTKSIAMFSEAGFRDMIREYGVTSTRPTETCDLPVRYADYAFVSPELGAVSFEVPDIAVSDHCSMILHLK